MVKDVIATSDGHDLTSFEHGFALAQNSNFIARIKHINSRT